MGEKSMLQLGTAKVCITPKIPVRLCGYATRTTTFEKVLEDIFLRVHYYDDGSTQVLFLYADILWWNTSFVENARQKISQNFNINEENIFFIASHNHSGPPTGTTFIHQLETFNLEYANFLYEQVEQGICLSKDNCEKVFVRRYNGQCNLNVFRRVNVDGKILMKPNYDIPADKRLTLIGFYTNSNELKGLQVHYACHANISNENYIQPDYPGIALRRLDETFNNSISLFLQGCTADLRPNCVVGDLFTAFDYEKTSIFAESFFKNCLETLLSNPIEINSFLDVSTTTFALPQEGVATNEYLTVCLDESLPENIVERRAAEAKKEWAQKILEKKCRPYEMAQISKVRFGDQLSIYTANAEMSQAYAQYVRSLDSSALFAAYTNGMIGYISTEEQINEGGYEPKDSALYFALSGTYAPEIEKIIKTELKKL